MKPFFILKDNVKIFYIDKRGNIIPGNPPVFRKAIQRDTILKREKITIRGSPLSEKFFRPGLKIHIPEEQKLIIANKHIAYHTI